MSKTENLQQHPKVEISVRNFGPITEANIDLRPLTVFIGPSNTGKTYFSTLVYALHEVFDGFSGFPIPFLQDLLAETAYDLRHDPSEVPPEVKEKFLTLIKTLNTKNGIFKFSDLPEKIQSEIQASLKEVDILLDQLKSCLDIESVLDVKKATEGIRSETVISLKVGDDNQKFWDFKIALLESDFIDVLASINKEMPFRVRAEGNKQKRNQTLRLSDFLKLIDGLSKDVGEVYYLPATRSGIMQSHTIIASSLVARARRAGFERLPEVPTFPESISDFLQQIILYKANKKPNNKMTAIADALESNVLYGKVIWKPSPSGYPNFVYHPWEMEEEIRLSQASSMVSELAPLVLFIRGLVQPGDTLIIEEPEAHLHPGAQTEIAATLARLVRAGVRVVVTTHSDWLLKEIGNLIREGILKEKGELRKKPPGPERWLLPDEVGAWQFHKEKPVEALHFTNTDGIESADYEELALNLYNRSAGLHNQLEETEGNNSSE